MDAGSFPEIDVVKDAERIVYREKWHV